MTAMKPLFTIMAVVFLTQMAFGQDSTGYEPSVAVQFGGFVSGQRGFDTVYGSNTAFVFGGGVGFPFLKHLTIVGKLTYFFKSNNGREWRQWIGSGGLKYSLLISENVAVTVSGGVSMTVFLDTRAGTVPVTTGNMNPGGFGGLGAEYHLTPLPLTVFFEADYYYLARDLPSYTHNYGGTEFSIGTRYRFTH